MATKEQLKAEMYAIKTQMAQLKLKRTQLQKEHNQLQLADKLMQENERLQREQQEIEMLKINIDTIRKEKEVIVAENARLKRFNDERKSMQKGPQLLSDQVWKPLHGIFINKFKEFDINGSGNIERDEFLKLCETIENELKVARLFSMLDQHSASTIYNNDKPGNGCNTGYIDSTQGWSAAHNDKYQWYQIDAVVPICCGGIIIQGRYNCDQWVKKFNVSHSNDGVSWQKMSGIFKANSDRDSQIRVIFPTPIKARYVRIHPQEWHNHISLRADLLWVENYDEIESEEKKEENKSSFSIEEQNKLFDLFDLKKSGTIDLTEFLAVLDRAAQQHPQKHPHHVIKETMQNLLYGNVNVKEEEYKIDMLGKESKGYKYDNCYTKCFVCNNVYGVYGLNDKCQHRICFECLQESLRIIMENGDFPAYCAGCKTEKKEWMNILFKDELLRYWVDEGVIELKFGVRFYKQQDKFIQELQFQDLMKSSGMRKCPNCGLVILKNEGCNWFRCRECNTEICYQTGLVAGRGPGKCGGGHSCHY